MRFTASCPVVTTNPKVSDERLADMAMFVINLHYTPAEYYALTLAERDAIVTAWNAQKG